MVKDKVYPDLLMKFKNHIDRELSVFIINYLTTNNDTTVLNMKKIITLLSHISEDLRDMEFTKQEYSVLKEILPKLLNFEPLTDINDVPYNWISVWDNDNLMQNRRFFSIFKFKQSGRIYNSEGYMFKKSNGEVITTIYSCRYITLPCSIDDLKPVILNEGELRDDMVYKELFAYEKRWLAFDDKQKEVYDFNFDKFLEEEGFRWPS